MRKVCEFCLDALRASALTEAACHPGRFFSACYGQNSLYCECVPGRGCLPSYCIRLRVHSFFSMGPGEKEFFLKEGCRSDDITLRRCADAWDEESLALAKGAIRNFYEEFRAMDKDSLLEQAKSERKAFLSQVGVLLKPYKFRKKGNLWTKNTETGLTLEFHAQKSGFSDEYYFNIRVFPTGQSPYPGCFQTRVTAGGGELFDWQLLDRQALLAALENGIRERLLPFLREPPEEMGKRKWVWQCCACRRTCCEHCWVAKNLWEYTERGNSYDT